MESKDLFEVLCEYASNTHFDEIICKDKEYSELLDEIIAEHISSIRTTGATAICRWWLCEGKSGIEWNLLPCFI